jgi:hypothetical protein
VRQDLRERVTHSVIASKRLDGGRVLDLDLQLFGARLCVGPEGSWGYDQTWDYESAACALAAWLTWEGEGEPPGWTRHVDLEAGGAFYRPEGDPDREWFKPAERQGQRKGSR